MNTLINKLWGLAKRVVNFVKPYVVSIFKPAKAVAKATVKKVAELVSTSSPANVFAAGVWAASSIALAFIGFRKVRRNLKSASTSDSIMDTTMNLKNKKASKGQKSESSLIMSKIKKNLNKDQKICSVNPEFGYEVEDADEDVQRALHQMNSKFGYNSTRRYASRKEDDIWDSILPDISEEELDEMNLVLEKCVKQNIRYAKKMALYEDYRDDRYPYCESLIRLSKSGAFGY